MSGFKSSALILSEKFTSVIPTVSGDISLVGRNGNIITFDGNVEKRLLDNIDLINISGGKQDTLISGTNIKTINGQSLLGSGNLTIVGGSGGTLSVQDEGATIALSATSLNFVGEGIIANSVGGAVTISITGYPTYTEISSITGYLIEGKSLYKNYTSNSSINGSTVPVVVGAVSGYSNKFDILDCSDSSLYTSPIGFLTENVSANQGGIILQYSGELNFPSSTFVPGLEVYCSPISAGKLTQIKPSQIGQKIVPVGIAKNDSVLAVRIESPFIIEGTSSPAQDQAVLFKSPSQFSNLTVNIGDILVLNDSIESHPNLGTNNNFTVYRCVQQYIGDGNSITAGELLSYFSPVGNQPKSSAPITFYDITSNGLGQTGFVVNKGDIVVIDDTSVYSKIIPGANNLGNYPVLVCTNSITGTGTDLTRNTLENNFSLLTDKKFKRTATTNNNSSSVSIDLSSTSYELYHMTVKVAADGSTGYKFFGTYQFGITGEPIGLGGCTIQGSITETILFNPLAELSVSFSDPGDTLQITFDSSGRTGETYTWAAWIEVERL